MKKIKIILQKNKECKVLKRISVKQYRIVENKKRKEVGEARLKQAKSDLNKGAGKKRTFHAAVRLGIACRCAGRRDEKVNK